MHETNRFHRLRTRGEDNLGVKDQGKAERLKTGAEQSE
jgi:hypothetical protein